MRRSVYAHNTLLAELDLYDFSVGKVTRMIKVNGEETDHYERVKKQLGGMLPIPTLPADSIVLEESETSALEGDIDKLKGELVEEQQGRRQREEYDRLALDIIKLPSRDELDQYLLARPSIRLEG